MAWTTPETYVLDQVIGLTEMHKIRDNMRELWHRVAMVEFTSTVTTTTHTELAPLDVVSSGAITLEAVPHMIEFSTPHLLIPGVGAGISLWEDSTDLGRMVVSTASAGPVTLPWYLTPTAASHTYKVRIWTTGAATCSAAAGAGGAGVTKPGFIAVWAKGGA